LVSGHHDKVWIAHSMRGRQVYSVMAPKTVRLCELPCLASERVVDLDNIELFVSRVELVHRVPELARCQSSETVRLRESRATLRVHESNTHNVVGGIPERGGSSRSDLDNEQRHDCGRIEVCDHRR
jgi:hypothetical protein